MQGAAIPQGMRSRSSRRPPTPPKDMGLQHPGLLGKETRRQRKSRHQSYGGQGHEVVGEERRGEAHGNLGGSLTMTHSCVRGPCQNVEEVRECLRNE